MEAQGPLFVLPSAPQQQSRRPEVSYQKGDVVESRSFMEGFKDAWFKSKVLDVRSHDGDGSQEYLLQFCSFPGEDPGWVSLHQVHPVLGQRELMIRPLPPQYVSSREVVLHSGCKPWTLTFLLERSWAVGDEVEGYVRLCWWRGTIARIKESGRALVKWRELPHGEGGQDTLALTALRPAFLFVNERWSVVPNQKGPVGRFLEIANPAAYYTVQTPEISEAPLENEEAAIGQSSAIPLEAVRQADEQSRKKQKYISLSVATSSNSKDHELQVAATSQVLTPPASPASMRHPNAAGTRVLDRFRAEGMEPAVRRFVTEHCILISGATEFLVKLQEAYVAASGDHTSAARQLAQCLKRLGFPRKQKRVPMSGAGAGLVPGSVVAGIGGLRLKSSVTGWSEAPSPLELPLGSVSRLAMSVGGALVAVPVSSSPGSVVERKGKLHPVEPESTERLPSTEDFEELEYEGRIWVEVLDTRAKEGRWP